MRFLSRSNFTKQQVQNGVMSDGLRESLWHILTGAIDDVHNIFSDIGVISELLSHLSTLLKPSIGNTTLGNDLQAIKKHFFSCEWYEVYNMLEYAYTLIPSVRFVEQCNEAFTEHTTAYRFVHGKIVPIRSKTDALAIEAALHETSSDCLKSVGRYLENALRLLSEKRAPDCETAIRMAMRAVESVCIEIVDAPQAKLDETFKKLSAENRQLKLPRQLKAAFKKFYGYTSDDGGLHSPLLDIADLDVEDAVFMLVACSGFISYLIAKASKAGIDLT